MCWLALPRSIKLIKEYLAVKFTFKEGPIDPDCAVRWNCVVAYLYLQLRNFSFDFFFLSKNILFLRRKPKEIANMEMLLESLRFSRDRKAFNVALTVWWIYWSKRLESLFFRCRTKEKWLPIVFIGPKRSSVMWEVIKCHKSLINWTHESWINVRVCISVSVNNKKLTSF